jgi:hypothetical protein
MRFFGLGTAKGKVSLRAAITSSAFLAALTAAELIRNVR